MMVVVLRPAAGFGHVLGCAVMSIPYPFVSPMDPPHSETLLVPGMCIYVHSKV